MKPQAVGLLDWKRHSPVHSGPTKGGIEHPPWWHDTADAHAEAGRKHGVFFPARGPVTAYGGSRSIIIIIIIIIIRYAAAGVERRWGSR